MQQSFGNGARPLIMVSIEMQLKELPVLTPIDTEPVNDPEQQKPRRGWNLCSDPPEPFPGSVSAADCNTSAGLEAVIQISVTFRKKRLFFTQFAGVKFSARVCVRSLLFL